MTNQEIRIDPSKIPEYQQMLEQSLHSWHEKEWWLVSYEEFLELAKATFPMYLIALLQTADETGLINTIGAQNALEEKLDWYYRQAIFDRAVGFIKDDGWQVGLGS